MTCNMTVLCGMANSCYLVKNALAKLYKTSEPDLACPEWQAVAIVFICCCARVNLMAWPQLRQRPMEDSYLEDSFTSLADSACVHYFQLQGGSICIMTHHVGLFAASDR